MQTKEKKTFLCENLICNVAEIYIYIKYLTFYVHLQNVMPTLFLLVICFGKTSFWRRLQFEAEVASPCSTGAEHV